MQSSNDSNQKKDVEVSGGRKPRWVKITVMAAVAAAAFFGFKALTGGEKQQAQAQAEPVVVVQPVEKKDLSAQPSEYVGRVEAIQSVQVRPQVSGEIARVCFKEGSIVKAGSPLFQIDPAPFEATVALRRAELEKAKASLADAEKYYKRVNAADARAVSAAEKDTSESSVLQWRASVSQAKAALRLAEIDLSYCRVTAPITGKAGKANFTKGNYVTPASGALASIVQMDPIRVSFSLPDRDYLDQMEFFKNDGSVYKTKLMLSNGSYFETPGKRDFEDNTVELQTGTVMMNLRYANEDGMLIPGAMVRIFTQPVKSRIVTVIPQTAIMADAKGDFVYLLGADNTVRDARVTLGRELGAAREVTAGVEAGDTVVVAGLQNLRPGVKVKVEAAGASDALEQVSGGKNEAN